MQGCSSKAASLASLPEDQRKAILAELTSEQLRDLAHDWLFWARPEQLEPEGDWAAWAILAGRGFGKTEAGAQWVRKREAAGARSIALVAETYKDLVEVMVPRLLAIYPPDEAPEARYRPVRVNWPSGAVAYGYVGNEPSQLRGPEFDTAWVDEFAKYRYARELWDMLQFTMRSGTDPRTLITTTPRPIPVLKEILADRETVVTRGSTFDNAANLDPGFLQRVRSRYEGTRLGRQELFAEILDDVPGALWTYEMISHGDTPELTRIVVAVDPSGAGGSEDSADEIGIVVAGKGVDGRAYVIEDATCVMSPAGWGRRAVERYHDHKADLIVAERNFGGAMVESVIRVADRNANVQLVTASRGKAVRAAPIAALYEQGKVTHAPGLSKLEDQMLQMTTTGYMGEGSPDRVDALVWALTELMLGRAPSMGMLVKKSNRGSA
ncbi:MAG: terminase family protein [Paracoccaceae bacterium]|nr:terminase family protein [Paracoccaceae bacterium]